MSKKASLHTVVTSSAWAAAPVFSRMSKKTAREVSIISALLRCLAGVVRKKEDAVVN